MIRATVGFLVVCMAGCAPVQSVQKSDDEPLKGISYYLPMRHAKVVFERAKVSSDAQAESDAAHKAAKAAEAEFKKLQVETADAKERISILTAAQVPASTEVMLTAQLQYAEAEARSRRAALTHAALSQKAQAAAVAAHLLQVSAANCNYADSVSVVLQKPVPDLEHRLQLDFRHSISREDTINIKSSTSGLLSTVEGVFEDQSAEILIALAQSAAALGQPIASPPHVARAMGRPGAQLPPRDRCERESWRPIRVERTFDPTDQAAWNRFMTEVSGQAEVQCKFDPLADPRMDCGRRFTFRAATCPRSRAGDGEATAKTHPGEGIYYRRELPCVVDVLETGDSGVEVAIGSFLLMLPNNAPADLYPMRSNAFVTSEHTLGLDQGMLVSVEASRPSELLKVVSLPWSIAQATMNVLTSMVQFRVNHTTQGVSLTEQQILFLEQQQALRDAQEDIRDDDPPPP